MNNKDTVGFVHLAPVLNKTAFKQQIILAVMKGGLSNPHLTEWLREIATSNTEGIELPDLVATLAVDTADTLEKIEPSLFL